MGEFIAWIVLTLLAIGVTAVFELTAITVAFVAVVAVICALIVWGGIIILDDLDF